jgi:hypothetical protein
MEKVEETLGGKMEQSAQPGDGVERAADSSVNDSEYPFKYVVFACLSFSSIT